MFHMKTASVRELRTEFPKVLAWVNEGQSVAITRRRKIVASLVPSRELPKQKVTRPDFRARLQDNYGDAIIEADVMVDILAENKGRY